MTGGSSIGRGPELRVGKQISVVLQADELRVLQVAKCQSLETQPDRGHQGHDRQDNITATLGTVKPQNVRLFIRSPRCVDRDLPRGGAVADTPGPGGTVALAEQTLFAGFGEVGFFGGSKRIFDGRAVQNGHQRLTQLGAGGTGSRVGQVGAGR